MLIQLSYSIQWISIQVEWCACCRKLWYACFTCFLFADGSLVVVVFFFYYRSLLLFILNFIWFGSWCTNFNNEMDLHWYTQFILAFCCASYRRNNKTNYPNNAKFRYFFFLSFSTSLEICTNIVLDYVYVCRLNVRFICCCCWFTIILRHKNAESK